MENEGEWSGPWGLINTLTMICSPDESGQHRGVRNIWSPSCIGEYKHHEEASPIVCKFGVFCCGFSALTIICVDFVLKQQREGEGEGVRLHHNSRKKVSSSWSV